VVLVALTMVLGSVAGPDLGSATAVIVLTVLAPAFARWLLGDRLSRRGAAGIGIALAGVVLVVRPSAVALSDASAVGQLLC